MTNNRTIIESNSRYTVRDKKSLFTCHLNFYYGVSHSRYARDSDTVETGGQSSENKDGEEVEEEGKATRGT